MNNKIKIVLGTLGLLILSVVVFISVGLYGMAIEDAYGDNQDIFYGTRQGDIVVNHETKELGEIRKTWTRFYVIKSLDTLDIGDWWDDKNIEIYRTVDVESSKKDFGYGDFDRLKDEGKLKLRKKLR